MTPEQMKMNPIKPIIKVKTNDALDTEEGSRKCSKRTLSRLFAVALRMYLTLHLLLFGQSM